MLRGFCENAAFPLAQTFHAFLRNAFENAIDFLLFVVAFFVFRIILESLAGLVWGRADVEFGQKWLPLVASHPQNDSEHQDIGQPSRHGRLVDQADGVFFRKLENIAAFQRWARARIEQFFAIQLHRATGDELLAQLAIRFFESEGLSKSPGAE